MSALARLLVNERTRDLETPVRRRFDLYDLDLAGRAQAFQKHAAGGVAVNKALATSGLLAAARGRSLRVRKKLLKDIFFMEKR